MTILQNTIAVLQMISYTINVLGYFFCSCSLYLFALYWCGFLLDRGVACQDNGALVIHKLLIQDLRQKRWLDNAVTIVQGPVLI